MVCLGDQHVVILNAVLCLHDFLCDMLSSCFYYYRIAVMHSLWDTHLIHVASIAKKESIWY